MMQGRYFEVAVVLVVVTVLPCLAAEEMTDAQAVLRADGTPGDPAYGDYIMQECTACHATNGAGGVPTIDGIAPGYFRLAMDEYADGTRENAVMESVARALGDEELAALAAWFGAQRTEED